MTTVLFKDLPSVGGAPILGSFYMGGQFHDRENGLQLLKDYVPSIVADPAVSPTLMPDHRILWPEEEISIADLPNGRKWLLRPGVTVVFGLPGAGKTSLLQALAVKFIDLGVPFSWVSFGEPESETFGSITDLAYLIETDMRSKGTVVPVVMVDSIKSLVYRSTGAAGARGVSSTMGEDISVLHVQARKAGLALILVVNPASSSKEVIETLVSQFKAGAGAVVDVQSIATEGGVLYADRENRQFQAAAISGFRGDAANLAPLSVTTDAAVFRSLEGVGSDFESAQGEDEGLFISDFES